jgi:hypothetical protein
VARLDVAIEREDPRRSEWAALRLLDAQPRRFDQTQLQLLAGKLERDPGMTAALAFEFGQRTEELEALERVALPFDSLHGLLTAIEAGPLKASPEQWVAWLTGCEQRAEITPEELELAIRVLGELPDERIEREQLVRLVVDQSTDNQAPGA